MLPDQGFSRSRPTALLSAAVASLFLLLGSGPVPGRAHAADSAARMYQPTTVDEVRLTLPPSSMEALEEDPEGAYQPGTFELAETDGTPGTAGPFSAPLEVGIRLKGSLGSFEDLRTGKAAFKIKFNSVVKGQKFLGLKKMTLNNMVQDPSMIHETLAYQAFHALGVPASNTGFAYLRVNGEDFGMHLNLEQPDVIALEKRFGPFLEPPQHLYEGEYGADVTPAKDEQYEVDEGDEEDRSDLEALVAAVNGGSTNWLARVEAHADLAEMTHQWAIEKYIGHWDGYAGEQRSLLPNNYYLYSSAAGVFQMLPWGPDQTWEDKLSFDGPAGVLFDDCLADTGCAALYREAANQVLSTLPALNLDNAARCTAERLRPWQELEASSARQPHVMGEIAYAVTAARNFITGRPAELASYLGTSAPPEAGEERCPPLTRVEEPAPSEEPTVPEEPTVSEEPTMPPASPLTPSTSVGPVSSPAPAKSGSSVPRVRLAGWRRDGSFLVARLQLGSGGKLTERAWLNGRTGRVRACPPTVRRVGKGSTLLRCKLSPIARKLLVRRWRRLDVRIVFRAPPAPPVTLVRQMNLPRSPGTHGPHRKRA